MPVISHALTTTAVENHDGLPVIVDPAFQQPQLRNSVTNSILAGYTAGVVGTIVGHPMDSLKVWMQTQASYSTTGSTSGGSIKNHSHPLTSSSSSLSKTDAPYGKVQQTNMSTLVARRPITLRTLYAGVSGPIVTVGILQSANFCLYDSFRRILYHGLSDYRKDDPIGNVALSALATGSIMSAFTSPMFVVKTKQQIMTWDFRTAIRNIHTQGSYRGFFIGFGPHFINETVGRAVYFCTYEAVKRKLINTDDGKPSNTLTDRMLAACTSGIACWAVIFPFDVLRSRVYAGGSQSNTGSAWQIAKSMYQSNGLQPFYKGFAVTVLRAGPVAAAVLPVYDITFEWLNKNQQDL